MRIILVVLRSEGLRHVREQFSKIKVAQRALQASVVRKSKAQRGRPKTGRKCVSRLTTEAAADRSNVCNSRDCRK